MSFLEKNEAALKEHHPDLLRWIENPPETDHIQVLSSASGLARLRVTRADGEEVAVHNAEDPGKAAEEAASKLDLEREEGFLILFGMGLGYLPLEIAKKLKEHHHLLICEADPGIFWTALRRVDLVELLSNSRVKILVGEEQDPMPMIGQFGYKYIDNKLPIVKHHPSIKVNPAFYEKIEKSLSDGVNLQFTDFTTAAAIGKDLTVTILDNLVEILDIPGVLTLKDRFSGKPAIVVGGGPSLEKNLHILKEAKGRAVIIAVDTVLKVLVSSGIVPDFLITMDPLEESIRKHEGVIYPGGMALVSHPCVYPHIIRNFPGPRFMSGTHFPIYQKLSHHWEEKGNIAVWTQSVTHGALNLARLLGADPIAFVGLDLCFSDQKIYPRNLSHEIHGPGKEEHYVKGQVMAANIFGEEVPTLKTFLSFRTLFEKIIEDFPGRYFHATEGGLPIQGTEIIRLEEFLAEFCPGPPFDVASTLSQFQAAGTDYRSVIKELEGTILSYRTIKKLSAKILKTIRKVERLKKAGDKPAYALASDKLEHWTTAMKGMGPYLDLLYTMENQLEVYLLKDETQAMDAISDPEERLEKQLERGKRYYARTLDSSSLLIRALRGALERVRGIETFRKSFENGDDPAPLIDLGVQLKEVDLSRAVACFEEVLALNASSPDLLFHLSDCYSRQHRYEEARELLGKIPAGETRHERVSKLDEECLEKLGAWAERCEEAEARAGTRPERSEAEALCEAGLFYEKAKEDAKAVEKFRRAVEMDPRRYDAYRALCRVYEKQEQYESCLELYEKALKFLPEEPEIYRDIGLFSARIGFFDRSFEFLMSAVSMKHEEGIHERFGDALMESGGYEKAALFYEAALREDPGNPGLLNKISLSYQQVFAATTVH